MSKNDDFHQQADELAAELEATITETEHFLDQLSDFAPRSDRSKKLSRTANIGE